MTETIKVCKSCTHWVIFNPNQLSGKCEVLFGGTSGALITEPTDFCSGWRLKVRKSYFEPGIYEDGRIIYRCQSCGRRCTTWNPGISVLPEFCPDCKKKSKKKIPAYKVGDLIRFNGKKYVINGKEYDITGTSDELSKKPTIDSSIEDDAGMSFPASQDYVDRKIKELEERFLKIKNREPIVFGEIRKEIDFLINKISQLAENTEDGIDVTGETGTPSFDIMAHCNQLRRVFYRLDEEIEKY